MNVITESPNSQKSKNCDIFKTEEYQNFLDRVDIEKYNQYIKKNQGVTFQKISEHFKEKEINVKTILNVWVNNWNTFSKIGRIVNKEEKFYSLSPRNPTIKSNNPNIYNLIIYK